ncbi:MAG: type I methionyl aminopeptidase [Candidatus Dependentiae bacterium]
MIKIKNKQAIAAMRTAGQQVSRIVARAGEMIAPGVTTATLDAYIEKELRAHGLQPVCKGYAGYRHASCISVNETVVHGVPSDSIVITDGDMVSIDVVGSYKGYCADMARTFVVGKAKPVAHRLREVAQEALDTGLTLVKPGTPLSDVSAAIQKVVEAAGFGVLRDFVGHGIGRSLHEDPQVPNFGKPGEGPLLRPGMTLAIEPMITEKHYAVKVQADGWTVNTVDGGLSAHVEDTVVVTATGVEILTRQDATKESV